MLALLRKYQIMHFIRILITEITKTFYAAFQNRGKCLLSHIRTLVRTTSKRGPILYLRKLGNTGEVTGKADCAMPMLMTYLLENTI